MSIHREIERVISAKAHRHKHTILEARSAIEKSKNAGPADPYWAILHGSDFIYRRFLTVFDSVARLAPEIFFACSVDQVKAEQDRGAAMQAESERDAARRAQVDAEAKEDWDESIPLINVTDLANLQSTNYALQTGEYLDFHLKLAATSCRNAWMGTFAARAQCTDNSLCISDCRLRQSGNFMCDPRSCDPDASFRFAATALCTKADLIAEDFYKLCVVSSVGVALDIFPDG